MMLNIIAVKTKQGYYITRQDSSYYPHSVASFLFDGHAPRPSFHKDWYIIDSEPKRVSHTEKQPDVNHRYILADDSFATNNNLPLEIPRDVAGEFVEDCGNGHFQWKDEYAMYRSLYVLISDPQPDLDVEDEYTFSIAFELPEIKPPLEMIYPVNERCLSYGEKSVTDYITNKSIEHQLVDKIIFPAIILHDTPCKLSSEESYKIIRWHVRQHINPKVAKITSDYDFHFAVSKVIPLAEPYTQQYEHRRGRHKPVITSRYISTREFPIFEITHGNNRWKDCDVVEGFEANTEDLLKHQIDNYLTELMKRINEPLVDCPHCNGKGVIMGQSLGEKK